jgi:hypothetical protein
VSRIWRALKEAERLRSRPKGSALGQVIKEARGREAGERRGSHRNALHVVLLIYGSDADKQPFHEESETHDIAENGCSLSLEAVVSRGQRLFLANTENQAEVQARVIHVGRRIRGKARVGLEFLHPSPEFWFPS